MKSSLCFHTLTAKYVSEAASGIHCLFALTQIQWMCHRSGKAAGRATEPERIVDMLSRLFAVGFPPAGAR